MKLTICSVVCVTMLALTSTVRGQVNRGDIARTSAALGLSAITITASQPASDDAHGLKLEIRKTLAEVLVGVVQQFFADLRTGLGLSAASTGSTVDPLAGLETAIEDAIRAAAGQTD